MENTCIHRYINTQVHTHRHINIFILYFIEMTVKNKKAEKLVRIN